MNFTKSITTLALASLLFVGCKEKTTEPVAVAQTVS